MRTAKEVLADAWFRAGFMSSTHHAAEVMLAALREAGYCVAPVEPTMQMLRALHGGPMTHEGAETWRASYRAMIEAAGGDEGAG